MHEFSIAEALAASVARHAPPRSLVREVEVRAGPLRGIDPEALALCWQAVTADTALAGSVLRVEAVPWTIDCPTCGATWESRVPFVDCRCGEPLTRPSGGDELELVALVVDDPAGDGVDALVTKEGAA
ncbi:MAG TPA: hydrogenase maturation nickel metallochaperone HypA [Candidatus Dormibacteraeota bacterium]|nr:hydrogenase maturation nickel metallochaperone HypA [Candidatus Dormibacteraeota bacterium]